MEEWGALGSQVPEFLFVVGVRGEVGVRNGWRQGLLTGGGMLMDHVGAGCLAGIGVLLERGNSRARGPSTRPQFLRAGCGLRKETQGNQTKSGLLVRPPSAE